MKIDSDRAITAVQTMEEVDAPEGQRRSIMTLLEFFASTGLLLAVVGIHA